MSARFALRRLSATTRSFLIVVFVLFNVFAVVRALPVNSRLPENREPDRGVYSRNVYRVFKLAKQQAERPFGKVKNHAIFFDRNPGMFMFVAELFVRAGATTPLPNQLLAIALWDIGLAYLFLWLWMLFGSELAAAAGLGFLLTTPFLLFYSSSIHHEPWCFCFFNLMLYCFVRYLKEGQQRKWLVATWVAYFFVCQSYWFYHMSAGIMLVALQVRERKFSLRDTAILALVPVVATLTTFVQVVYALDGVDNALFRMKDIAAARTLDMRIENSRWSPDRTYLHPGDFERYPITIMHRIQLISGYHLTTYVALMFTSAVLAGRRLGWLLLVVFAGISWHLVMIQHTVIHRFAGMYGWFMWVVIVTVCVCELQRALQPRRANTVIAALAIPLCVIALQQDYVPYLLKYVANARAGEASAEPSKKKVRSADKLSAEDMKE